MNKNSILFIICFLFNMQLLFAGNSIKVKDAGLDNANGIYVQQGDFNGHPVYVKGDYKIRYKGCKSKWVLLYKDKAFYKNFNDSDICPIMDWQMTCTAKKDSLRVPTLSKE